MWWGWEDEETPIRFGLMGVLGEGETQIPFGNDSQNGNSNHVRARLWGPG
ncbi:hypothetical protein GRAN_2396 [Granulicella sibirica]|uniref:Uncharacterized protein n=1 Tax=Granulicella sibirica TaxID=2479048 RepID=A0A4Q0T106_9BACT|nr:hypothetical protein GRAN_2396 [Granulicella sibirica]